MAKKGLLDEIIALEAPTAGCFPHKCGLSAEQIKDIESVVDDYITGGLTSRKPYKLIVMHINKKFGINVSVSTWRRYRDDRKQELGL